MPSLLVPFIERMHFIQEGLSAFRGIFAGASCPGSDGVGEGNSVGDDDFIVLSCLRSLFFLQYALMSFLLILLQWLSLLIQIMLVVLNSL